MSSYLVTGGSGFFGGLLKASLAASGHKVVNVDLVDDPDPVTRNSPLVRTIRGDIRDARFLEQAVFAGQAFDGVFHCAAILAHAVKDERFLWESNVDGTRNVAEACVRTSSRNLVFLSSNCLWAENFGRPVKEDDTPNPIEIYGRSKWEGEKILQSYQGPLNVVTLRCPTIMDAGRLGLLGILFEFIDEGRKVWVVGGGKNRYQFIYGSDLMDACVKAVRHGRSELFNIGSDDVKSFHDVYSAVIARAGTGSRVANLPKRPTLLAMRAAHALGVSPLGPYQYKMIAEDFLFDTSRIKSKLDWRPTFTNEEMLFKAYDYYRTHIEDIRARGNSASAHRQVAKMGVIRLLKWVS